MYVVKLDANDRPVAEGIEEIVPVVIPSVVGEVLIKVPANAFSFGIKRLSVEATININETAFFPVDEGDQYGSFLELKTVKIDIKENSTEDIVFIFVR